MESLFSNILTASFHGSIVIAVVILLRLVLKKAPRKFICFLWLLAGLRLLMPFEIQSSLSLQPMPEVSQVQQWQAPEARPAEESAPWETLPEPAELHQEVQLPRVSENPISFTPTTNPTVERPQPTLNWRGAIPYVWLFVAACFGIYTVFAYLRLKYKVREAVKIPGGWECDRIETAFILGFIRPKIYIPMGLSPAVRKHILAHERTHLEKGDHWFKMIGFLALALHWFNPLVWIAYVLLCKDIELACDERVVQFMDLEERKSYSAALLSCSTNRAHFAACPVAFGEVSVKDRIKMVLNYRRPGFWVSLLGVIAIAFVAVCLLTNPTEKETSDDATDTIPAQAEAQSESEITAKRISDGLEALVSADDYHLFIHDDTNEGGVGWQIHFVKDGENTLWWSTGHRTQEGHMVLNQRNYTYVEKDDGVWVATDATDNSLEPLIEQFSFKEKELFNIKSEVKTNDYGITYEELTFTAQSAGENGQQIAQPVTVIFDENGGLTGIRIFNSGRKGGDIFTFSTFDMEEPRKTLEDASARIVSAEEIGPIEEETEDERLMKEWGIEFRVDDDRLSVSGSEVWFAEADGYDDVICTDDRYWLEKKTDSGWEVLSTLTDDIQWKETSYVLSHGMYTMVYTQWSDLYGTLPGGVYRLGKTFTNQTIHKTCTGYGEFQIFENPASTAEQKAAVEKCYAAVEELKNRAAIHYKVYTTEDDTEEIWWNNGDYTYTRSWLSPFATDNGDSGITNIIGSRVGGVGYGVVKEDLDDPGSATIGIKPVHLNATTNGWELYSVKDNLYLYAFERGNESIDFSASECGISQEVIVFHKYYSDPGEYNTMKFYFDSAGRITKMVSESHYDDMDGFSTTFEIFPDAAGEIDTKIQSSIQDLYVSSFSWKDAKAKYATDEFNHRDSGFVNNDMVSITNPVDAARRALKEYPKLGDYLSLDVSHDDGAKMWRVTVKSYHDYQSTDEYRDIYLDDNGVTQLLVYEGPIGYDESRK